MNFGYSSALLLLAVIAFLVGVILSLSVVTKSDDDLNEDRANTTRSTLFLLVALVLAVLILSFQKYELADSVKNMLL